LENQQTQNHGRSLLLLLLSAAHPAFLSLLLRLLILGDERSQSLLTPQLDEQPAFGDEQLCNIILAVSVTQSHTIDAGVLVLHVE